MPHCTPAPAHRPGRPPLRGALILVGALALAGCVVGVAVAVDEPAPERVVLALGEGLSLGFVSLPGGSVQMGSPDGVGYAHERPARAVQVEPFAIAEHEVTVGVWSTFVKRPVHSAGQGQDRSARPVDKVPWCEALQLANHLSGLHPGAEPVYALSDCEGGGEVRWDRDRKGFRLPTEAEWEYAARAGTRTLWWTGDDPASLSDAAWIAERGSPGVRDVGTKSANPWGLYDVHGNVWEWTWDAWAPYDGSEPADPRRRVVRGGGAWWVADMARSAFRYPRDRRARLAGQGLRLVVDAEVIEGGAE